MRRAWSRVAGFIYLLWTLDVVSNVRVAGIVMLVCGFAASGDAVVPGFDDLLHGNKAYLVLTSLIGVLALVGGERFSSPRAKQHSPYHGCDGRPVGSRDCPSSVARRALTEGDASYVEARIAATTLSH